MRTQPDVHRGRLHRAEPYVLLVLILGLVALMRTLAAEPALWAWMVGTAWLTACAVVRLYHRADAVPMGTVLAAAVLARVLLLPLPPVLSDDAFRYVWDGWLRAEGLNPFLWLPTDAALAAMQASPLYGQLNSASYYSVYPPTSQWIFWVAAEVADTAMGRYYVIKAVLVGIEMGGVVALSRMVTQRWVVLYALQPLVLLEGAGQGHTEAAAVGGLLVLVYAVRRHRRWLAGAALAVAGWAKLIPFVLAPMAARRAGARTLIAIAVVSVILWAPFADVQVPANISSSLALYTQLFEYNAGLYYALKGSAQVLTGADWSKQLGPLLQYAYLIFLAGLIFYDRRRPGPLARVACWALGGFLVFATTVHPWYLMPVLAMAAAASRPAWHWHWLALLSLGTYLFYQGGPYWPFVIVGWGGWLVLAAVRYAPKALTSVQRRRSEAKARRIRGHLEAAGVRSVLDLGAGEGYVGEALERMMGAKAHLADVVDMNRTKLPHTLYDGRTLPYDTDRFDGVVLYFVLHHCEDPERVLAEAARVARLRIVVVESVYRRPWEHRLLRFLDRCANRIRSGGQMNSQEAYLAFRTAEAWRATFERRGLRVVAERRWGSFVHRQALFVLGAKC